MIRRTAIPGVLCAALAAAAGAGSAPPPPNIVFIMSDDHRWDGLGAAGNPHVITPNLDRLAREGVHFLQATMHVPQCSPGRVQLLTGLPPHRTGWYSNQHRRPDVDRLDGALEERRLDRNTVNGTKGDWAPSSTITIATRTSTGILRQTRCMRTLSGC